MRRSSHLHLLIILTLILGCQQDDEHDEQLARTKLTQTEIITAEPWRINEVTISPPINKGNTLITDLFNDDFEDCKKDDLISFNITGLYRISEGPTKCNENDPQEYLYNWSFYSNEEKIIFDYGDNTRDTATLVTLDQNKLVYTRIEDFGGDTIYTITHTLGAF